MQRRPLLAVLLLAYITTWGGSTSEAASVADFVDFSRAGLPGRMYVPPEATGPVAPRPLILFLHGAGETGSNNQGQINQNIDNLLIAAKQRGAFLYAPQATTFSWGSSSRTTDVMTMIDQALMDWSVDANRLYVTGLSMGGGGAWNMLNRFSDRFAAGLPIAGVSPSGGFDAANLIDKPVWAFHARDDGVVTKNRSRNVVNSILAVAGEPLLNFPPDNDFTTTFEFASDAPPLNYTEFATGGHGIWFQVYDTTAVYDWMFSQQLVVPEPGTAGLLCVAVTLLVVIARRSGMS